MIPLTQSVGTGLLLNIPRRVQRGVARSIWLILATCFLLSTAVYAQTKLDLVDQLPPFLLSAQILSNGHFSITTNYTGTNKTLIYREDGTGNRPVNYTSHLHVNVDGVVFQLPFEVDRTTDFPPPPNPLTVLRLFRDTVQQRPRINAVFLARAGNGDSIRVTFTMEPVQRPSGGFIRLSASVENAGAAAHNVGVLMLVDTKIGNNDRAPIGTAFGYSGIESEFRKATPPGIPEFWIAFEGTPLAPGLTARGNLRASELIEPDRFLFGNWVDDNSTGIPGLYKVLWDERTPSGLSFTDSAILLLWEQQQLAARARRLVAATEIGLVDSLVVAYGTGSGGGGGGGGGSIGVAGPGTCLTVSTAIEDTCGKQGYKPYSPDTVASLYLATNTGTSTITGLQLVIGALPQGLQPVLTSIPVIPSTLLPDQTGVTVLPLVARPRLQTTSYAVPIAFVDAGADTILRDTVCVEVPGILASIVAKNTVSLPVCPGSKDTFALPVELFGIRCLPVYQATIVAPTGQPPATILTPLPLLPADGTGYIMVESAPLLEQQTDVQVRIVVRDWESLRDGDTTWVEVVDTATITIVGKHAEVTALLASDTLVLPTICVRDTAIDSMQVQNIGGCDATLTNVRLSNDAGGVFTVGGRTLMPQVVQRGGRGQVFVAASSTTPGTYVGELEITTPARPNVLRVPMKVVVDKPGYDLLADTVFLDTICPGVADASFFRLINTSGCDVLIDSVRQTGLDTLQISPQSAFLIGARSSVSLGLAVNRNTLGPFASEFRVYSQEGGDRTVVVVGTVADRSVTVPVSVDAGRIRVNWAVATASQSILITNTGTIPVTVAGVTFSGQHAGDFYCTADPPNTLPHSLAQGQSVLLLLFAAPQAIGLRQALATVQFAEQLCTPVQPIRVQAYGVQPLLDVERHDVQRGRLCVGAESDTLLVMRNLGNEPVVITGISCNGSADFTIPQPLPITIDSGAMIKVPVVFAPAVLGQQQCECVFDTDADWFTPQDTTVRMGITGIACGTIWADTARGYVGQLSPVSLHMESDERSRLTTEELSTIIAAYNSPTTIRLTTDPSLVRYQTTVTGQLQGALASVDQNGVTMSTTGLPNVGNALLAVVDADVLLGPLNRANIGVELVDFVDGLHHMRVHSGLITADYCALDQRRVQVSNSMFAGVDVQESAIRLIGFARGTARVCWYSIEGVLLECMQADVAPQQTTVVGAPEAGSGPVTAVIILPDGVQTAVVYRMPK